VSEPYPDPTANDGDWTVVDFAPAFGLKKAVTLDDIKGAKALRDMVLVRQSRLSVQPVRKAEFDEIVRMGGRQKA
jgi:predicted RNA-binding protein with PUA-like domain